MNTDRHPTDITAYLAARALAVTPTSLPPDTLAIARQSLLDWWTLVIAARQGRDVARLGAYYAAMGKRETQATLLGSGERSDLETAAMLNGVAGHLMDFDDAHLKSRVHPSVPLWPAILAYAEHARLPGRLVLAAFVAGVEVQSRLAAFMGESHYKRGWHNTATFGSFGATAAIGVLKGMDEETLRRAYGIVATMSGGMHKSFGTAAKPLQVARAAANGLFAAGLAETGFNATNAILDGEKSFPQLYADEFRHELLRANGDHWAVRDIVFKYHASCYGTQAPIDAALQLAALKRSEVSQVRVYLEPQYMTVCNIQEPRTETEAKFSVRHTVALALAGYDTARSASFERQSIEDPEIQAWHRLITVHADDDLARANARIEREDHSGSVSTCVVDASRPEADLDRQQARLQQKSRVLLDGAGFTPQQVSRFHEHIDGLGACPDFSVWMGDYRAWMAGA